MTSTVWNFQLCKGMPVNKTGIDRPAVSICHVDKLHHIPSYVPAWCAAILMAVLISVLQATLIDYPLFTAGWGCFSSSSRQQLKHLFLNQAETHNKYLLLLSIFLALRGQRDTHNNIIHV